MTLKHSNFDIPGIDDCDYLFTASDGDGSVYIRVQEHPYADGVYYAAVTVDSDSGSFVENLEDFAGPYDSPEAACKDLNHHFEWFADNGVDDVEHCTATRRALNMH